MHPLMPKLKSWRLAAMQRAPYFSHALLSLFPIIVPNGTIGLAMPTLCVTADYIMLVEEGALQTWNLKEGTQSMIHEISHLIRLHFKRRGDRDPKISNMAGDMEINDDLEKMFHGLEGTNWLLPRQINEEPGKPFEYYYEKLKQQPQPKSTKLGGGACGGCAGNPLPGEASAIPAGAPRRTKAEAQQIATVTAHKVRETLQSKKAGTVPLGLQKWAELHGAPPEVPWQEQLTRACRRAIFYRPGAVDYRWNKPSRRQAGLGYGPGVGILPALNLPVPQVAVMFDTSGSMGKKETESAARETDGVLKAIGARVKLCVVDAMVHALQDVTSIEQVIRLLKGGGGTDFNQAFRQLEETRPKPEVIVVVTDGYAFVPKEAPSARVIWCLIGRDVNMKPAAWGDVVRVT